MESETFNKLDPFQQWAVRQHCSDVCRGVIALSEVVNRMRANGYDKAATALEEVFPVYARQFAVEVLVKTLKPFKQPVAGDGEFAASGVDEQIRDIVRTAMQQLEVYDAHGCPLCLS